MKVFVEGGGDSSALKSECRKGFGEFIKRSGVSKMPKVIACGSRGNAIEDFSVALTNGEQAMLLIDSERPVLAIAQQGNPGEWNPWLHLSNRPTESWDKPSGATSTQCHFMVECMEAWFLADHSALQQFWGNDFQSSRLPPAGRSIESISKSQIYSSLKQATAKTKKGEYGKGDHSFKLLALIDPSLVIAASPWAKRFIDELKEAMDS